MIQYHFLPTSTLLSEYIPSYGLMELPEGLTAPLLSPPNGLTGFVIRIKCGKKGNLVGKDFKGNPIADQPSYAIGQTTLPITGCAVGQITFLMVFFHPLGMYQLFGCKMGPLANKSVHLVDFLGNKKGQLLIDKLESTDNREQQISILDNFFLQQNPIKNDCTFMKKAIELIHEAEGNISIKTIEKIVDINRRTLERHFLDKVGISPKVYAQIYRFKCAMNYLKANPNATWTELSYNNGFFDQAHMIRYFKGYLKVSPNNLVRLDIEFINYLLGH